MSAWTGDLVKTVVPKSFMASTRIDSELGGANRHQSSVGNVSGLASCQVWVAGSRHCGESSKHLRKFRVGTLNVKTLRGRVCEVEETLSCRKVDVCCIQETRYRGGNCRTVKGKDTRYKLYWSGNNKGIAGVGVFVAEEWIESRPCRRWIQGSAWWDGVWQAGTRCWGWENPRVHPSIWPASWEHVSRNVTAILSHTSRET